MLVKEAKEYGSISKGNTKMPGTTYAVDSFACHVGEMLSKKAGSICEQCNMRRGAPWVRGNDASSNCIDREYWDKG